ncbi:MAG: hypothetical protein R6V56_03690 [Lentisphaeria bacterium]
MSRPTLTLRQIAVHRFLGIPDRRLGFDVPATGEFCSGINIVYGPNASGKTTTGRAIQELLWPGSQESSAVALSGDWFLDAVSWSTSVEAGRVRWLCDGNVSPPPPLPPATDKRQYWFALHELLQAEDRELAEAVQYEIYGGLDLKSAAEELGFEKRIPKTNIKAYQNYQQAEAEVRQVLQNQRELKQEAEKLNKYRRELVAADRAREMVGLYQALLKYRKADTELQELQRQIKEFDSRLEHFHGTESESFADLSQRLTDNCEARRQFEAEHREAKQRCSATGFDSATCPQPETIKSLKELQDKIQNIESQMSRTRKECAGLTAKENSLVSHIADGARPEKLPEINAGVMQRITEFARDCEEWSTAYQAAQRYHELLAVDNSDNHKALRIEHSIQLLIQWLQLDVQTAPPASGVPAKIPITASVFVFVMVLLAGIFISPWWLIASIIPVFMALLCVIPGNKELLYEKQAVRKEYEKNSDLPSPGDWCPEAINKTLGELASELANQKLLQLRDDTARAQKTLLDGLIKQEQQLKTKKTELETQTGLAVDIRNPALAYLAERVSTWQQVHGDRIEAEAELDQMATEKQELSNKASTAIKECCTAIPSSSEELNAIIDSVEERVTQFRDAQRDMQGTEKQLQHLNEEVQIIHHQLNKLLQRTGIRQLADNDDPQALDAAEHELQTLAAQFKAYSETRENLNNAERQRRERRTEIGQAPGFKVELLDLPQAKIEAELHDAKAAIERSDDLRKTIAGLESRVATAKQQSALENALDTRENAGAALNDLYDSVTAKAAGNAILNYIREHHQKDASQIMTKAGAYLSRITRGQWELDMRPGKVGGGAAFLARNTENNLARKLDELSSATRVQLLLAVRLAFVETLEGSHTRLPLILDETLSNSDSERETAAMQALVEIARTGRQIIYFTAQQDEAQKWLTLLNPNTVKPIGDGPGIIRTGEIDAPDTPPHTVPLALCVIQTGNLRLQAENLPESVPELRAKPPVPPPEKNMTYDDYGRLLKVPAWDPGLARHQALHLWYILPDKQSLFTLLSAGYYNWGQLKLLFRHDGENTLQSLGIDKPAFLIHYAQAAAALLEKAAELQLIGQNRCLNRDDLYRSPVNNSKYIDEVADCAESVNGDPQKLLELLTNKAVTGFGPKMIARLQAYLEDEGFIDPRAELSNDAFQAELDRCAADHPGTNGITRNDVLKILSRLAGCGT